MNLPIHLRTRKEMSKVDTHWGLIKAIKGMRDEVAPQILLTINGDILDRQRGMELATRYGIDGAMIGRGIFHNSFAFEKDPHEYTSKKLLDLLRLHLELFEKYLNREAQQFKSLRCFSKIYMRDIRGASELQHQLIGTEAVDETRTLLDDLETNMEDNY